MALLIDSSVFISLERRGLPATEIAGVAQGETPVVAAITASELYIGIHRANTAARQAQRTAYLASILSLAVVVPFDLVAAREHARLNVALAAAGTSIGPNDLIIAATALAHGHTVMTDNLREFRRVPDLVVLQPIWPI